MNLVFLLFLLFFSSHIEAFAETKTSFAFSNDGCIAKIFFLNFEQ
jgi:hypothetical protein